MKANTAPAWNLDIKRQFRARVRTEIVDAVTGIAVKTSPWVDNLVLDGALSYLAGGGTFAGVFTTLKIGSGTDPTQIAGGAITFTQAGTTITASGIFFTAAMVGAIFKYGTGTAGAEQYIASIGGGGLTCVVTGAGMTVGTPTVGTVWQVQATALQTYLAKDTGYQTNAGDNSTTLTGGSITHQRTFIFATPGVTQNINEIGYTENSANDGTCLGRIVLPSTDVVDTSHFYRVVMQLAIIVAPAAPTAVGNVGTNINTAGNVMFEYYDLFAIGATGAASSYQGGGGTPVNFMDGVLTSPLFGLRTTTWSQPGAIQTGNAPAVTSAYVQSLTTFTTAGQPLGQSISTTAFSWTAAGETLYGFMVGWVSGPNCKAVWTLKLTATVTLPSGTFQGTLSITKLFTRTLTN